MVSPLNNAVIRLPKRAESSARDKLIQTFVDVGPLFTLLSGADHQILYGRRGTGKTHVLNYLADNKEKSGDAVVVIDLRNIGSNSGIYADGSIPFSERATRLLVDTLLCVHSSLYEFFVERSEELDLSRSGPALDQLAEAITQVKVVGGVEKTEDNSVSQHQAESEELGVGLKKTLFASFKTNEMSVFSANSRSMVTRRGEEQVYVNFGATGTAFRNVVSCLAGSQLWVLLDEWSSIPLELQPYLADLIRRSIFPVQGITVKIAAIEHRSSFVIWGKGGEYTGIEVGADASADVNLDDFMVFDNDSERSISFFQELISQHVLAVVKGTDLESKIPDDARGVLREAFTEKRAVEEFVRACEGVPRDAINIIALSAQRALDNPISVNNVRVASNDWYHRDKERVVSANEVAEKLMHWIVDQVIGGRRARAFLLRSDKGSELIDALYDARVLHIIKRGVSSHDQPGVRYDVYKLDYGCYVDLLTTTRGPQGLLPLDDCDSSRFIEVPPDDYRSIRRAILDLGEFYSAGIRY